MVLCTPAYASDVASHVTHSAKQVMAAVSDRINLQLLAEAIAELAKRPSFNTVSGRRRIADAVIKAGRYIF